jgi:sulfur carrier protein
VTRIDINGEPREVAPQCTLLDLLGQLELAGQPLALAVNRAVVPRQQWHAHRLQAGDRVDIVRAIGGG